MIHSTGANNPNLKRYVGPNDGLLGDNKYNNHWNTDLPNGQKVCVHAFIGKLENGSIATYQTLPWNHRAWHAGSGKKGSANDTHISFEICEDNLKDKKYFDAVYKEAVELTAMLCKKYKLDPLADGVVICHSEGYKRGIASNHGDVMHWFPKHGKSMDTFRADVAKLVKPVAVATPSPTLYRVQVGAFSVKSNAVKLAAELKAKGYQSIVVKS
jgi:N-acetylmuramoyl-L-alanine amidase CwlA